MKKWLNFVEFLIKKNLRKKINYFDMDRQKIEGNEAEIYFVTECERNSLEILIVTRLVAR